MSRVYFKCFNKIFTHTPQCRAMREDGTYGLSHNLSKCLSAFYCYAGKAIATQPVYFIGYFLNKPETGFYSFGDQILYYIPVNTLGSYHVTHNLTIASVQTDRNLSTVSIETENLKDIRTQTYLTLARLNNSITNPLEGKVMLLLLIQLIFIIGNAHRKGRIPEKQHRRTLYLYAET